MTVTSPTSKVCNIDLQGYIVPRVTGNGRYQECVQRPRCPTAARTPLPGFSSYVLLFYILLIYGAFLVCAAMRSVLYSGYRGPPTTHAVRKYIYASATRPTRAQARPSHWPSAVRPPAASFPASHLSRRVSLRRACTFEPCVFSKRHRKGTRN